MQEKPPILLLNTLIQANSLVLKSLTKSFIMKNTIIGNQNKGLSNTAIIFLRSWSQIYETMALGRKSKNFIKIFFSPTRPHKSKVYEKICFRFKKTHIQTKKFPLANLFVRIYVFSLQKIKDRALCFSTKKSTVRVVF